MDPPSTLTSETNRNIFLFGFISFFFSLEYVFTYAHGNQISNRKYLLEFNMNENLAMAYSQNYLE